MKQSRTLQPVIPATPVPFLTPADVGEEADRIASKDIFTAYRSRRRPLTVKSYDFDLDVFKRYLAECGVAVTGDLKTQPPAWHGITWGLIQGFIEWQVQEKYAISSINRRLATIKLYISLAAKANVIPPKQLFMVQDLRGFRRQEGQNINRARGASGKGIKKTQAASLTFAQADQLKHQPDTPQGRRDALLMCLLLDHGLRCGEVAGLEVEHFHLGEGTFTVYRSKVDMTQEHELSPHTLKAFLAYQHSGGPVAGSLWYASDRHGNLSKGTFSTRSIYNRVHKLGQQIGIPNLGPHDCRHLWTLRAHRGGTGIKELQEAGGWSSPAMPLHYMERNKIANQGVKLKDYEG
jgi:integrase